MGSTLMVAAVVEMERREEFCDGPDPGGRRELGEWGSSRALLGDRASEGLTAREGRRGVLGSGLAVPTNRMRAPGGGYVYCCGTGVLDNSLSMVGLRLLLTRSVQRSSPRVSQSEILKSGPSYRFEALRVGL